MSAANGDSCVRCTRGGGCTEHQVPDIWTGQGIGTWPADGDGGAAGGTADAAPRLSDEQLARFIVDG